MEDKIVHLHVHQAVRFGGTLSTYFSIKPSPGKVTANFKMRPDLACVEIYNDKDKVLVPLVNISAMHLDCAQEQERDKKKAAEAENKKKKTPTTIKRPR